MSKVQDFEMTMSKDVLTDFLVKVQDVAKTNTTMKIVFDEDKITLYAFALRSKSVCKVSFMDTYTDKGDLFLPKNPKEFSKKLEMVIEDAKKFVKKMAFYRNSEKVTIVVGYRQTSTGVNHIVWMKVKDKKLKMTLTMQELHLVWNIPKEKIISKIQQTPNFVFNVDIETLNDVKKLSQLNAENEVMSMRVMDNIAFFEEEGRWEMEIGEIQNNEEPVSGLHVNFGKKHFNNLENSNNTLVKAFDDFLLIEKTNGKDTLESFLMLGVERTEL